MKISYSRFLLLSLSLMPVSSLFASDSISSMLTESIYLLELLVIALVTIALIVVTVSIGKSRHRIAKVVTDIREEMGQERAVLSMTVQSVKEKEKQISYLAHLLQTHLEDEGSLGTVSNGDKKKVRSKPLSTTGEILVEIIDEMDEQQSGNHSVVNISDGNNSENNHSNSKLDDHKENNSVQPVDPRFVAADGSIKRAHFGPDQYLAEVTSYQQQVYQRIQHSVKQADQFLTDTLENIWQEMDGVKKERSKLDDFISSIKSNIRTKDTQRMNGRDSKLIQELGAIDKRLETLELNQHEIEKNYIKAMTQVSDFEVDQINDKAEAESIGVA